MLSDYRVPCTQSSSFDEYWIEEPVSWISGFQLFTIFIRWDCGYWFQDRGGEVWNFKSTSSFLDGFDP
jgi:hypothetical protein